MSRNNSPFDISTHDLGDATSGIDRLGVDQAFSTASLHSATTCIICNNTAAYKLIPKHKHLNTAEIEDRGYACQHCITQRYVSPDDYGLREL